MTRSLLGLFAALATLACQAPVRGVPGETLRVSELVGEGDAARRASMRLVMSGIEADENGSEFEASSRYERALQVDPNNGFAWLALARQEVFEGDAARGLAHLDKAEALLGADPRVAAHLAGIRGAGLAAAGRRSQGEPFLEEARELAPGPWTDGKLDASELR